MSRKLPGISYYTLWGHLTIEPKIVYVENNYHISDTGHFCVEKNCARNCVCGKKLPHLSQRTLLQKMYVEKNWAKKCVCGEKWPHLSHGTLSAPSVWPQLNINMSRDCWICRFSLMRSRVHFRAVIHCKQDLFSQKGWVVQREGRYISRQMELKCCRYNLHEYLFPYNAIH